VTASDLSNGRICRECTFFDFSECYVKFRGACINPVSTEFGHVLAGEHVGQETCFSARILGENDGE